jgi:hypothetical protein
MVLASDKLDLRNQLDNDMFNHVTYVTNRILMMAKKEGVNKDTLTVMGKYLWRLFRVFQAYNTKKREPTLKDIVNIVLEFKSVFTGA